MTLEKTIDNLESLDYHNELLKMGFEYRGLADKGKSYNKYLDLDELIIINVFPKSGYLEIESDRRIPFGVLYAFGLRERREVEEIVKDLIKHITTTKAQDLWKDYLDLLKNKKYITFILAMKKIFDIGEIIDYCDELIEALEVKSN